MLHQLETTRGLAEDVEIVFELTRRSLENDHPSLSSRSLLTIGELFGIGMLDILPKNRAIPGLAHLISDLTDHPFGLLDFLPRAYQEDRLSNVMKS